MQQKCSKLDHMTSMNSLVQQFYKSDHVQGFLPTLTTQHFPLCLVGLLSRYLTMQLKSNLVFEVPYEKQFNLFYGNAKDFRLFLISTIFILLIKSSLSQTDPIFRSHPGSFSRHFFPRLPVGKGVMGKIKFFMVYNAV